MLVCDVFLFVSCYLCTLQINHEKAKETNAENILTNLFQIKITLFLELFLLSVVT